MIEMSFEQFASVTNGKLVANSTSKGFTGVSIDSRSLLPGQLFVALKGEHTDGHMYIEQAVAKGASGVVTELAFAENSQLPPGVAVIGVSDTHDALLAAAINYRDSIRATRIGISGSNGKTTTKEITYQLLMALEPRTYRSPGNLNNLFGAPLALFGMPTNCKLAVLEMGVSEPGEMKKLARVVKPDLVVITNIAVSHLELLGDLEGVAKEELDLISSLPARATILINADDEFLVRKVRSLNRQVHTFGVKNKADFLPKSIRENGEGVEIVIDKDPFVMNLFGEHQVYNLLAAYGVARLSGYNFENIDTRAIRFETAPFRGQREIHERVTFILDCYNSNPESLRSGLRSFSRLPKSARKILVLGDMLELGPLEAEYHHQAGMELKSIQFDFALFVGPLSRLMLQGAKDVGVPPNRLLHFESVRADASAIASYFRPGDLVYLKASRGIGLEGVYNAWKQHGVNA